MKGLKRVGLLGGTFDPMHFGHINLALELQEAHALDEIIICPAAYSPFKSPQDLQVTALQRFEMIRLAIEGLPTWRVIDWELQRQGPSYTIDTVKALYTAADKSKEKIALYLLLGQDVLQKLADWKEIEKLFTLAPPLIGGRIADQRVCEGLSDFLKKNCQAGMTPTRTLQISSTDVRDRLKRRLYCYHLLPAKVLDFIYHHQLYLH